MTENSMTVIDKLNADRGYINDVYNKVRKSYPKLARIEDGERDYWWIDRRNNKMLFAVTVGKDGCECPIVDLDELMNDDFVPEEITPGYLIDKYEIGQ